MNFLVAAFTLQLLALKTAYTYGSGCFGTQLCVDQTSALTSFIRDAVSLNKDIHPVSSDYEGFIKEIKASLDSHMLPDRAIHHLFSDNIQIKPYCNGDWMEFGVAYGGTINLAATWREQHCGQCPHVHGFDTFTGLPEYWKRDQYSHYEAGTFDLKGKFPGVKPNVNLVQGLFNESLPAFLKTQAKFGVADAPLSFLHVDCDLYAGAADVFKIVGHKIVPGTVIVFDDLVNYQFFREGEMLAWWQFLQSSGAKFTTIGMLGPLGRDQSGKVREYAMEVDLKGAFDWYHQSAAFVITSIPGKANPFETTDVGERQRRRRTASSHNKMIR